MKKEKQGRPWTAPIPSPAPDLIVAYNYCSLFSKIKQKRWKEAFFLYTVLFQPRKTANTKVKGAAVILKN